MGGRGRTGLPACLSVCVQGDEEEKRGSMRGPTIFLSQTPPTPPIHASLPPSLPPQFVVAELGTEGSIDGNSRLVLRGKYVPKGIESLLRKYIGEYVACTTCKSPNTALSRDSVSRLYFVHCQSCGSSRSVAPIRTGFHAQTRADRRALRK